jgi:hypothetical protein
MSRCGPRPGRLSMGERAYLLAVSLTARFTRRMRFPGRERLLRALFPPSLFRRRYPWLQPVIPYGRRSRISCNLGSWVENDVYTSRVIMTPIYQG